MDGDKVWITTVTGEATANDLRSALSGAGISSELTDVTGDEQYQDFRLDREPFRIPAEDRLYEVFVAAGDTIKASEILRQNKVRPVTEAPEPPQRRFVRVIRIIGGFFSPAFVLAVIYMFLEPPGSDTRSYYALVATFTAAVMLFSWVISRRPAKEQRARQKRADRIADALRAGACDEEFCLFLRSFSYDGAMTRRVSLRAPSFMNYSATRSVVMDLEDVFSVAWDDLRLPLVALGEPGARFGSAQIQSDDKTWKELASRAMDEATVIMMTPGASVGTLWEADYIVRNRLLEKCLFLMPPHSDEADWAGHWDRVLTAGFKWSLPPYTPDGMLFRNKGDGSIEWSDRLPRHPSIERIRGLLRQASP